MKKRTVVILIVCTVVAGIAIAVPLWKAKHKSKVEWVTVSPQKNDIQVLVTATGTINAVKTVQVGTQVSGVISRIYADFNDKVVSGQVIAQLDIATLRSLVQEAEANEIKAISQLEQIRNEYERNSFLWAKKVISRSDYEVALANFQTAKTTLAAARAEVTRNRTNLQYATIKAPISGVIVSRNVDVGQTVAASFATPTLFVIANDLRKMQVQANVDEADIGQVNVGQDVMFTVDAYPDLVFKGTVNQIRLQPNTIQNVVNYTVIIDAPNPDLKLLPGMNTDISIVVKKKVQVLSVPVAAIKYHPQGQSAEDSLKARRLLDSVPGMQKALVFVLEKEKVKPVVVNTGLSDGVNVEIIGSRLSDNERILVGVREKGKAPNTKGLFQGPHPSAGSSIRNMR